MSFDLDGAGLPGGVLGQDLTVGAGRYVPLDRQLLPLGTVAPVADTPFDSCRAGMIFPKPE